MARIDYPALTAERAARLTENVCTLPAPTLPDGEVDHAAIGKIASAIQPRPTEYARLITETEAAFDTAADKDRKISAWMRRLENRTTLAGTYVTLVTLTEQGQLDRDGGFHTGSAMVEFRQKKKSSDAGASFEQRVWTALSTHEEPAGPAREEWAGAMDSIRTTMARNNLSQAMRLGIVPPNLVSIDSTQKLGPNRRTLQVQTGTLG